jgi:hypothetical protein
MLRKPISDGKGKDDPVLFQMNTMPWMRNGEGICTFTHS